MNRQEKHCHTCEKVFITNIASRKNCYICSPQKESVKNKKQLIKELNAKGMSYRQIANQIGCSKSTVSSYIGKSKPHNPKNQCMCGNIKSTTANFCRPCYLHNKKMKILQKSEPIGNYILTTHGYFNAFTRIRELARKVSEVLSLNSNGCHLCSYTKHTHVCHIKPISSFSKNTPINIVNSPNNLICLCPNCHWEFDNGKLVLEEGFEPSHFRI